VATVRYRVDGVPQPLADAWTPMPTLSPAGSSSVSWSIYGAWGTEPVPVSPNHTASGTLSRSPEWLPPSAVPPDWFRPQVAVQDITRLGPPVHWMPLQAAQLFPPVIPIGERGPQGPSAVMQRGRKIGGRRSMHWPRVFPFWPNLRGGNPPQ